MSNVALVTLILIVCIFCFFWMLNNTVDPLRKIVHRRYREVLFWRLSQRAPTNRIL